MSFMTKKFKNLYAFALTVGPFSCTGLVNDWQHGVSMRLGSLKKMCVGIIYKYFSHSSFEIQSAPKNLLEVEFGKLNAA